MRHHPLCSCQKSARPAQLAPPTTRRLRGKIETSTVQTGCVGNGTIRWNLEQPTSRWKQRRPNRLPFTREKEPSVIECFHSSSFLRSGRTPVMRNQAAEAAATRFLAIQRQKRPHVAIRAERESDGCHQETRVQA